MIQLNVFKIRHDIENTGYGVTNAEVVRAFKNLGYVSITKTNKDFKQQKKFK